MRIFQFLVQDTRPWCIHSSNDKGVWIPCYTDRVSPTWFLSTTRFSYTLMFSM